MELYGMMIMSACWNQILSTGEFNEIFRCAAATGDQRQCYCLLSYQVSPLKKTSKSYLLANWMQSVLLSRTERKKPDKLFYLVAACWGGRSASQMAARWSSGWPSHSAPSTCWLSPKCWSSSRSSRRCLQRGKRRRGVIGTRGPWGSRWPRCRRRVPRK